MRTIESLLVLLQVFHELQTVVDTIGLKAVEIQPATGLGRVCFTGEVDELN